MSLHVVTEGPDDRLIVEHVLDAAGLRGKARVYGAGGYSAAVSLARSLLVKRADPVALVLDADSTAAQAVEQRRQRVLDAIADVADPDRVLLLLVEPAIEVWLLPDADVASRVLDRPVGTDDLLELRSKPHDAFSRGQGSRSGEGVSITTSVPRALSRLRPTDLLGQTQIAELVDFIRQAEHLAPLTA